MSVIEVKNTNESNSQGPPGINKSGKFPLNQKIEFEVFIWMLKLGLV